MASSLGKLFVATSFGESHGRAVGVVIDGCPAGLPLNETDIQPELDRRRPGQSETATLRDEADRAEIWSGIFRGYTTGAPLCLVTRNQDADSSQYEAARFTPRPGHADYTSFVKYGGYSDYRGGGRFSGRLTAGWVMAGAVAKKLLAMTGVQIDAYTIAIGGIEAATEHYADSSFPPQNQVHCPDTAAAEKMTQAILTARQNGDSLGGVVEIVARGMPPGWGEPVANTLEGDLARAYFAIPAVKGVEFGAGFKAAAMHGSENNDQFVMRQGKIEAASNNAGGILGGISSGMALIARIAIKPTPSITQEQRTVNLQTLTDTKLHITGRHDACIVPRAVVVAESVTAIVLCDFALQTGALPKVIT